MLLIISDITLLLVLILICQFDIDIVILILIWGVSFSIVKSDKAKRL